MNTTRASALGMLLFSSAVSAQPAGVGFYENLERLPYLHANVAARYLSSYDRSGGNDDGFRGTYSALHVDDNGEHVIFDEKGPGCVYNFWFTGSGRELHWGKLRFYLDEDTTPRFECEAMELFQGRTEPFVFPLATHAHVSSGGFSCSAPIPFADRLKITTERRVGFYNVYYQLLPGASVESWTPEIDYSPVIARFERCGTDPKRGKAAHVESRTVSLEAASGRTRPEAVLLELERGGTVRSIKIDPLFEPDAYTLNHVHLKIEYDGAGEPAVDVPIGSFFGSGLGEANVAGLFVGMRTAGAYYCYLPMPFRRGIRISLENRSHDGGGEFFCEIGHGDPLPEAEGEAPLGYFGATYRNAWPIVEPTDYVLLDRTGRGAVVGQVMTVEPVKADRKRWWEGDMRIFIDGETEPRFHGTGHEDEYQGGWSTFWLTNPYSLPLFGEPRTENLIDVFGQVNGSTTVYRFWPGGVPFHESIRISTEHGNQNDTPANYSSLVYYYFLPDQAN